MCAQGVHMLLCNIYLLSPTAKLVISDVDGTVTKSDVLGQMLPRVGVDWSHAGVTALHQSIASNGYQVWPLQDILLLLVVCARVNRPFILPARLHCPHY